MGFRPNRIQVCGAMIRAGQAKLPSEHYRSTLDSYRSQKRRRRAKIQWIEESRLDEARLPAVPTLLRPRREFAPVALTTAENDASRSNSIRKFPARSTGQPGKSDYFQIPANPQKPSVCEFFTINSKTLCSGTLFCFWRAWSTPACQPVSSVGASTTRFSPDGTDHGHCQGQRLAILRVCPETSS